MSLATSMLAPEARDFKPLDTSLPTRPWSKASDVMNDPPIIHKMLASNVHVQTDLVSARNVGPLPLIHRS